MVMHVCRRGRWGHGVLCSIWRAWSGGDGDEHAASGGGELTERSVGWGARETGCPTRGVLGVHTGECNGELRCQGLCRAVSPTLWQQLPDTGAPPPDTASGDAGRPSGQAGASRALSRGQQHANAPQQHAHMSAGQEGMCVSGLLAW